MSVTGRRPPFDAVLPNGRNRPKVAIRVRSRECPFWDQEADLPSGRGPFLLMPPTGH